MGFPHKATNLFYNNKTLKCTKRISVPRALIIILITCQNLQWQPFNRQVSCNQLHFAETEERCITNFIIRQVSVAITHSDKPWTQKWKTLSWVLQWTYNLMRYIMHDAAKFWITTVFISLRLIAHKTEKIMTYASASFQNCVHFKIQACRISDIKIHFLEIPWNVTQFHITNLGDEKHVKIIKFSYIDVQ